MSGFRDDLLDWGSGEGADARSIPLLIDSYSRFLNRHGYAIRRCNLGTETVHPLMTNTRHAWYDRKTDPSPINMTSIVSRTQYDIGQSMIDELCFAASITSNSTLAASPFSLLEQQSEVHEAILPPGEAQKFPVFNDLAELGCTDYYCTKLKSFAGKVQRFSAATDRPGGFDEESLAGLRDSLGVLALLLNTVFEHDIKETLSRIYLGGGPGRRVCDGMIHPGEVVSIEAAIWFSDIRGFTASSQGFTPEALVDRLNAYFEVISGAIYRAGGEILKYIGDGVLAIFPVGGDSDARASCRAALDALYDAQSHLAKLNAGFAERGDMTISDGVGLHLGTASYGNIGSRERLDFTVVGPAVNLASRIESMCKVSGEPALCSAEFREAAGIESGSIGRHELRGVAEPVTLYRVPLPDLG